MWTAGGVIRPSRFVKASTAADNRVLECDAGERSFGISQEWSKMTPLPGAGTEAADTAGDKIKVYTLGEFCILELGSGGATRGDYLMPDADGKGVAVSAAGDNIGALCFESGAEGAKVRVQVDHFGSVPGDFDSYPIDEIVFDGATGVNEIIVPDNLADALSIKIDAGADLIVLTSTNSSESIAIGSAATQKIGLYGETPVVQAAVPDAILTSITHTAPSSADYAIQDLVDSGGFGFVTKDEGNTVLSVVLNLQTVVGQMRTALINLGAMADS